MKKRILFFCCILLAAVSHAVLIVDYTGSTGNINSRAADTDSLTGDVWNFSDTTELITRAGGTNQTVYGGMNTSWSVSADYAPFLRFNIANIQVLVNPANGSDTALEGMYVWKKEDFLNGGDSTAMGFESGDSMSIHIVKAVGTTRDLRFVIKQEDVYYVSNQRYTGQTTTGADFSIDPTSGVSWAPISTDGTYTMGTFTPRTFDDIQAVGLYVAYTRTGNSAYIDFDDFQVDATEGESAPPGFSSGVIVDYFGPAANVNARAADVDTNTGDTWNFSDTTALLSSTAGTNGVIYGGYTTSWSVPLDYAPFVRHNLTDVQAQVRPNNGSDVEQQGLLIWNKADFLNDSSATNLGFEVGDSMSMNLTTAADPELEIRFVVKQSGSYYVSSSSFGDSTNELYQIDPTSNGWTTITTDGNYSFNTNAFSSKTFSDIQAVGLYIHYAKTNNQVNVKFDDFLVTATAMEASVPVEIGDITINVDGDNLVFGWQGAASVTYALQWRESLLGGSWSNAVENISGVDGMMSVTNGSGLSSAFFRITAE